MDLMPVLTVVYQPHPLLPASDRQTLQVALGPRETIQSIVRRAGLEGALLRVGLNGVPIPQEEWDTTAVAISDILVLHQGLAGETAGAWLAAEISSKTAISLSTVATIASVTAFAVNAVIAYAISALAGSLAAKRPGAAQGDDAPTAFSIEGGSNSARNYEPLQLVLGEHHVFPDYAGRPFGEFVPDPTTATEVINNTPVYETRIHPPFGFEGTAVIAPWVLIRTDVWESGTIEYYGDQASRTYTSSSGGTVTQPHTFVISHQGLFDSVTTYEDYLALINPPQSGGD